MHDFMTKYAEQAWLQAALPPSATVLDIAAGTGALTLVAAQGGHQILSTDFSADMMASVAAHALPNVRTQVMDGQALDLADASFDAAFSLFGIMLFPDYSKGLSEMARVLRPGGLGCMGSWASEAGAASSLLIVQRIHQFYPDTPISYPVKGVSDLSDPTRLLDAMTSAGFADVIVNKVTFDFIQDEESFMDISKKFQASKMWQLDDAQKAVVVDSIKESLQKSGGKLAVPSPAWIATGRKV